MRVKLTDRFVSSAKATDGKQTDLFDETVTGLSLRVSKTGWRAWNFNFTSPKDRKRARISLGTYPGTTLAAARARATEARQHLEAGHDPKALFADQAAAGMTVAALVTSYMEKHVRPNLRTAKETERRFYRHIVPIIGSIRLNDLHRRDVNRVVDPILARKRPTEAAHAFEDVRAMLRWAVSRGDMDRNPAEGMRKPATADPRERVLSDDEFRTVWEGLPKIIARSVAVQRIIRLCLVTAQRVGEVSGMATTELDLKNRTWTIPAARAKNGYAHRVPLTDLAVSIIEDALKDAGPGAAHVFPNLDGDGPLPARAVAKTVAKAQKATAKLPLGRFGIPHWTCHDLRRTAVTGMARLGIPPIVLAHVINHRSVTKAGVTMAVYAHYDYAKEKREALELWAERLAGIIAGEVANVVALRP
ncbi:MAG: hypothetical protein RL274_2822 [Pseudomonadota bacterium]